MREIFTRKNMLGLICMAGLNLFSFSLFAQQVIEEDFETASPVTTGYNETEVTLFSGKWLVAGVLKKDDSDHVNGEQGVRFRGNRAADNHFVAMNFDKTGGVGTVSFKFASFGTHKNGVLQIQYSENGTDWLNIGESITVPAYDGKLLEASVEVNNPNAKRIRIQKVSASSGNVSVNVDDIRITSFDGEVTSVATPSFTPPAGEYLVDQSVSIASVTDGAIIRYTTDGSDPVETSTLYESPIHVSATTTLKAKAWKEGLEASAVATAGYVFPKAVASIADLRAEGEGAFVKFTGEALVTFAPPAGNRNAKYIQDATGAILIDDNAGIITGDYTEGDAIGNITGSLADYGGMLQFVPATDAQKGSSGNPVNPEKIALDALTVDDQAKLVEVSSLTLAPEEGQTVFERGKNVPIAGAASVVLRPQYYDLDYLGLALPEGARTIKAVVLVYNGTIQLVPRKAADISGSASLSPDQGIIRSLYSRDGNIVVDLPYASGYIEVYNTLGIRVAVEQSLAGENTIPVQKGQLYIVRIDNQAAKLIVR